MSKHTPTPWHVDHAPWMGLKFGVLYKGSVIAECREITPDADRHNAEHIVKCVNAHDRLVEALRKCVNAIDVGVMNPEKLVQESRTLLDALESEKGGEL